MARMLSVMRRNFQNIRKSPRVADENMLGGGGEGVIVNEAHHQNINPIFVHDLNRTRRSSRPGWNALSVIYSVVRAPLSIISCFTQPHVNSVDGVWVSREFAQISEINHLMVSDSMRYAILM